MLQETEWMSSHPNHAKRLAHTMRIDHTKLEMTTINVTAKALAALGLLSLVEICKMDSQRIFEWFNSWD